MIRFAFVYILIVVVFGVAVSKIIVIQTKEKAAWLSAAENQQQRSNIIVPARRGTIYSENGQILAATIPYYRLKMDTQTEYLKQNGGVHFRAYVDSLSFRLAQFFGDRTVAEYKNYLLRGFHQKNRQLSIGGRYVSYLELIEIRKFPLFRKGRNASGLIPVEVNKRTNPFAPLAKRTIGGMYADLAMGGSSGIEMQFDALLRGTDGKETPLHETILKAHRGCDIVSTLNMEIQETAQNALENKMLATGAERGCVIVMDVKTGEVRACVNLTREAPGQYEEKTLLALTENMPPGSTFKVVSMMVALDDGTVHVNDTVDTGTGERRMYGKNVSDRPHVYDRAFGRISAEDIISRSSNVGTAVLIDKAYHDKPERYVDLVYKTKIQEPMELDLPGVGRPNIRHPKTQGVNWYASALPMMSFGYETTIPPIYMLRFYNAIANGGKMINPFFVKAVHYPDGRVEKMETKTVNRSICSEKTRAEIIKMLKLVMTDQYGTGYGKIRSKIVEIAGKTGTAELNMPGGAKNYASFCGFFPADKPQYTMYVMMFGRSGVYGNSSGEVFKNIAERIYARRGHYVLDFVKADTLHWLVPKVKYGSRDAIKHVLSKLDVDVETSDADNVQAQWVRAVTDSAVVRLKGLELIDGLVPNVVGMGAQDAVYLMEQRGLHVQVYGCGSVAQQSQIAGRRVARGSTVILYLK